MIAQLNLEKLLVSQRGGGGAQKVVYKGRPYKIHRGQRGGSYIIRKGEKVYLSHLGQKKSHMDHVQRIIMAVLQPYHRVQKEIRSV